MVLDADCRGQLADTVTALLRDNDARKALGENARKMALEDADEKIVDHLQSMLKSKTQKA